MAGQPVLVDTAALLRLLTAVQREEMSRAGAAEILGCSQKQAGRVLGEMEAAGAVKRFGARWYPPAAVTEHAAQRRAVEGFLRIHGFAYRAELSRVLSLPPRPTGRVLRELVAEGVLTLEGQVYRLKKETDRGG